MSAYVHNDGYIEDLGGYCVFYNAGAVRPVLRITNLNDYKVGEDFKFGGQWFRIVNDSMAFCLDSIGHHEFDGVSNDYEKSEIKKFIDAWFYASMNHQKFDPYKLSESSIRRSNKKLPDIKYADLLTPQETVKLPKPLLKHGYWWQLRSPGYYSDYVAFVSSSGSVNSVNSCGNYDYSSNGAVRPALRISNLNDYKVGDDFKFGGEWFRIIDDNTAFCLNNIGVRKFNEESNNYETSKIKDYIDNWFNNAKSKLKESVENKMNFRFKLVEDLRESSDGDIRDVFDKLLDYCYQDDVRLDFPNVDKFYNRVTFYARYRFDKSIPVYVGINESGKIYAFIDDDVLNKKEFADAYQLSNYIVSVAKNRHELSEDYDEEKVAIANRTSRTSGASAINKDGTIRSVVGRYVLDNIDKKSSILDFGAGKDAVQTQALKQNGFENVTAYDFGVNVKNGVHDPNALNKKYDVVFASNVLNVSSDEDMLRETLRDINKAAAKTIIFNYPNSPRKAGLSTKEVEDIIVDEYGIKPTVVVGPKSSPVWRIEK